MATIPDNSETLFSFTRSPGDKLKSIGKDGEPLVLTVGGKAKYVIHDAATYRKLLDALDRAEAIAGIRRGLEEVARGETRPLSEVIAEKKRKYGLPD
jgi:PHD/YefM family antitoxin component YafN of YafNO toxin-antitoxin module